MNVNDLKDVCVHGKDRWNKGCEMCSALNDLSGSNITLQKYDEQDFELSESELKLKYGIED